MTSLPAVLLTGIDSPFSTIAIHPAVFAGSAQMTVYRLLAFRTALYWACVVTRSMPGHYRDLSYAVNQSQMLSSMVRDSAAVRDSPSRYAR